MSLLPASKLSKVKTYRASVLPYTVLYDDDDIPKIYYLIARDKISGEWNDFGGGVKKNETVLEAGYREFQEESRNIFVSMYPSPNSLSMSAAILDIKSYKASVIFLPVKSDRITTTAKVFNDQGLRDQYKAKRHYNEIDIVEWISEDVFWGLVQGKLYKSSRMWNRCRDFYNQWYTKDKNTADTLVRVYKQYHP
jgi:hypothetical protein